MGILVKASMFNGKVVSTIIFDVTVDSNLLDMASIGSSCRLNLQYFVVQTNF